MTPSTGTIVEWLSGPNGGLMALALGAGIIMGFSLAERVCARRLHAFRAEVKREMGHVEDRIDSLKSEVLKWQTKHDRVQAELMAYLRYGAGLQRSLDEAAAIVGVPPALKVAPQTVTAKGEGEGE